MLYPYRHASWLNMLTLLNIPIADILSLYDLIDWKHIKSVCFALKNSLFMLNPARFVNSLHRINRINGTRE